MLTKGDVCAALKISDDTLDRWIERGEFPQGIRLGRGRIRRWVQSDVDALIQRGLDSRREAKNPAQIGLDKV